MNKKKQWSASSVILLIIGLGMIVGALALLIPTLLDYKKSNDSTKKAEIFKTEF